MDKRHGINGLSDKQKRPSNAHHYDQRYNHLRIGLCKCHRRLRKPLTLLNHRIHKNSNLYDLKHVRNPNSYPFPRQRLNLGSVLKQQF